LGVGRDNIIINVIEGFEALRDIWVAREGIEEDKEYVFSNPLVYFEIL